jgi:hypothetical protein
MIEMSHTAKRLLLGILWQSIFFLLIGWLVIFLFHPFEKPMAFLCGLSVGAVWSMIRVVHMERGLAQAVTQGGGAAGLYAVGQYFVRFLLTGVLLFLAAVTPWIGLWGLAVGLLTLQTSAFLSRESR